MGDHLKKRRMDLGLRQKDVARELGVNFKTYENWEQGKYEPETRFVPAIVRFLGYDPAPPEVSSDVGERLRAVRRTRGLSQEGLARLLGIDEGTVQRFEAGKSRVRPDERIQRLIREFLEAEESPSS